MKTQIINGTQTASKFLEHLQKDIAGYQACYGTLPSLAIVRVGHNPESLVYVNHKIKIFKKFGLPINEYWFEESVSSSYLEGVIRELNSDKAISGIIIQLPLPASLSRDVLYQNVSPDKDVDGLTLHNQGKLFQSDPYGLYPCTPLGCIFLLQKLFGSLGKKQVLILGRSLLVGKPLGLLCLDLHATVTMAHSQSPDLRRLLKEADIIISATGSPRIISGDSIKQGSVLLDVGIHVSYATNGDKKILSGDIDRASCLNRASYCTPVPGGIGPLTIAFLAYNTLKAAYLQKNILRSYDFENYPGLVLEPS